MRGIGCGAALIYSVEAMPEGLVGLNAVALNGRVDPEHHDEGVKKSFAWMALYGLRNAQGDVRCPQMLKDVLPCGLLRTFVDLAGGVVCSVQKGMSEALAFEAQKEIFGER